MYQFQNKITLVCLCLGWLTLALACGSGGDSGGGIGGTGLQKSSDLPYYSTNVIEGYESIAELEEDLLDAGRLLVYEIIDGQLNDYKIKSETRPAEQVIEPFPERDLPLEIVNLADSDEELALYDLIIDASAISAQILFGQLSDFETNVEVEEIDEADTSKSNGNLLFFAKGSELIVMNLSGNSIDRVLFDQSLFPELEDSEEEELQSILLDNQKAYILSWNETTYSDNNLTYGYTRLSKFSFDDQGVLLFEESKRYPGYNKAFRKSSDQLILVNNIPLNNHGHFRTLGFDQYYYAYRRTDNYLETVIQEMDSLAESWKDKVFSEIFEAYGRTLSEDDLGRMLKVHQMLSGNISSSDDSLNASRGMGSFNSYLQICVIDLEGGLDSEKLSGEFTSNLYQSIVYIDEDRMAIGGYGLQRDSDTTFEDVTFFTTYEYHTSGAQAVATGSVPGYVPETFGMRYNKDHYEFISTQESRFNNSNANWTQIELQQTYVSTYKIENNSLVQLDLLSGLGTDETLKSSRFVEDRAYVVTFLETDPFYVIDMSDPTQLEVLGELEIPGYSSYLHPVSSNILIGVGRINTSLLLNLFDVSDPYHPDIIQQRLVNGYSSSGVESDHKAFRYVSSTNSLILPLSSYSLASGNYTREDGFRIYAVDEDSGFTLQGNISHLDEVIDSSSFSSSCYQDSYLAPRSFLFSADQIVTVKGHSVISTDFTNLIPDWEVDLQEGSLSTSEDCLDWFGTKKR